MELFFGRKKLSSEATAGVPCWSLTALGLAKVKQTERNLGPRVRI